MIQNKSPGWKCTRSEFAGICPRRWHGELFAARHCNLSIISSPLLPPYTFLSQCGPACNHPLGTALPPLPTSCPLLRFRLLSVYVTDALSSSNKALNLFTVFLGNKRWRINLQHISPEICASALIQVHTCTIYWAKKGKWMISVTYLSQIEIGGRLTVQAGKQEVMMCTAKGQGWSEILREPNEVLQGAQETLDEGGENDRNCN